MTSAESNEPVKNLVMIANENLMHQLETLATYSREDLDYPVFEVFYEDASGREGCFTVCCLELASRAESRIKALEVENEKLKTANAEIVKKFDDSVPQIKHDAIIEMVGAVSDLGSNLMYAEEIQIYAAKSLASQDKKS